MKHRITLVAIVICSLVVGVAAQQLETNDGGGSMTFGAAPGANPTPGTPVAATPLGQLEFQVGGGPGRLYLIAAGQLAATSMCPPILGGECFDLNTGSTQVIIDGFMGHPFGLLNANGSAAYSFPNLVASCNRLAFQSIVADPATQPLQLNFTAAGEFLVGNAATLVGDDDFTTFDLCQPYTFYGQGYTQLTVSTNGWIKFGGGVINSDLGESASDFISGNVGGAGTGSGPVIAMLWDDLDVGNDPNQNVEIREFDGRTTITWNDADYFPNTPIGTLGCEIHTDGRIIKDYRQLNIASPAPRGIIGVSAGDPACPFVLNRDMVAPPNLLDPNPSFNFWVGGVSNACETLYQDFNAASSESENVDLTGVVELQVYFLSTVGAGGYNITTM